jgi:glycosyltransferase involved in cell wall biosynthesis
MRALIRNPFGYLKTLLFSLSLTQGAPRKLIPYIAYFIEAVMAGEYFRESGVASIHTHFSSTVLLILSRLYRIPYSMTIHGPDEFNDVVGFHMAEKVAGAQFISTISHYASSQVMRASDPSHWERVFTRPLGVDTSAFSPRTQSARDASAPFRLIFVGRLAPAKAQHVLIRAVKILKDQGRNVHLTIVGEGPSRASLEGLVRDLQLAGNVTLAGACNHDKVANYYRTSDAFVLASFAEGVPVVLMEAMAVELPCVATWITGIPELIEDKVEGYLVPPSTPDVIAERVAMIMDNPDIARQLALAGRKKVMSKYDLQRNTVELGQLFERNNG